MDALLFFVLVCTCTVGTRYYVLSCFHSFYQFFSFNFSMSSISTVYVQYQSGIHSHFLIAGLLLPFAECSQLLHMKLLKFHLKSQWLYFCGCSYLCPLLNSMPLMSSNLPAASFVPGISPSMCYNSLISIHLSLSPFTCLPSSPSLIWFLPSHHVCLIMR